MHLDDVLVADASRRTTTLNAYVSGYGSTRRVVLYDNVVHDLPRDQILSIVAHELGHAHHDDVLTGSLLAALGTTLGRRAARPRRVRPYAAARAALRDPTVVPLVLALVAIGDPALEPGQQRAVPADRDPGRRRLAARRRATRRVHRDAEQLALHSLSDDPPAWSQFWFGSHPTTLRADRDRRAAGPADGRAAAAVPGAEPGARPEAAEIEMSMAADPPWIRGHQHAETNWGVSSCRRLRRSSDRVQVSWNRPFRTTPPNA